MFNDQNLIWIDMEMTGLRPERDRILEIAVLITDSSLNILAEVPVAGRAAREHPAHGRMEPNPPFRPPACWTGAERRRDEAEAENQVLDFIRQYVPPNTSLSAATASADRRFLYQYMPTLEAYFHYRNLDVSTLKSWRRAGVPS